MTLNLPKFTKNAENVIMTLNFPKFTKKRSPRNSSKPPRNSGGPWHAEALFSVDFEGSRPRGGPVGGAESSKIVEVSRKFRGDTPSSKLLETSSKLGLAKLVFEPIPKVRCFLAQSVCSALFRCFRSISVKFVSFHRFRAFSLV